MKFVKFLPWLVSILLIVLLLLAFLFLFKSLALAQTTYYLITDPIAPRSVWRGDIFFRKTLSINYTQGEMWISSNPDGTGDIYVDDEANFYITPPDGKRKLVGYAFHVTCLFPISRPPQNVTSYFAPGINIIDIQLEDRCGDKAASSRLYFVNTNSIPTPTPSPTTLPTPTPTPAVTPFLRLPWDYESEGLTFNEAALNMSAYFDHEFPLLSISQLGSLDISNMVLYSSSLRKIEDYTSHDGYDFAKKAKAILNKPVLAAADGTATYLGTCAPCGNAILIDHGNGYQTRYYHMQKDGLITSDPNIKVSVKKGQQIGKIGATGNVIPRGDAGAHIHFMVVQDKNNDGNFNDNIPDGLVDPFGWQSKDPDPWENFTFTLNEKEYTGNKSYYLWDKALDNLDATLTSNGGVFKTERYELKFPPDFTDQNLNFHMESAPNIKTENNLESVGSSVITWIKDSLGNEISQYQALYELIIDYQAYDLTRFKPESIAIYSSQDGIDWFRENTQIDFLNKKASTKLDHMTHFALMGEPIDQIAPTTTAILKGEKGKENWYRSNVTVSLQSTDNENGLGVDYTLYKVNDEDWQQYTTSLEFINEGNYIIEFYSVDQEENIEEVKKVEFSIDKTPPEVKIYANQETLDMTIEGMDQNQTTVQISQANSNNIENITIEDSAGNTTTLLSKFNNKDKKDDLTIYHIKYNNLDPIEQPYNKFMLLFNPTKERIKMEKQYLEIGTNKINLQFDFDKQTTKITTEQNGIITEQQMEGFKLLQLETMSGTLKYSY